MACLDSFFLILIFTASMLELLGRRRKKVLQSPLYFKKKYGDSGQESNKIWLDQGSDLHDKGIDLCSTYTERKSVVA